MSNLTEWAKEELNRLDDGSEIQEEMNRGVLEIVEKFSEQGHSGFSAAYALGLIEKLLQWKPITPITGDEEEWMEVYKEDDGVPVQQNKRCSAIFRKNFDNSTAYYIDGKVFSDDGGETFYTCKDSFVSISFPYVVPKEPEKIIRGNQ